MFIEIPELKDPYLPFYDVLTEVKNIGTDYKFILLRHVLYTAFSNEEVFLLVD